MKNVMRWGFLLAIMVSLGCAKPTKAGKTDEFKTAKDKLEALATKDKVHQADIQKKIVDFDKEFKAAAEKKDEEATKEITKIVARMNKYHAEMSKAVAKAPATGAKTGTAPPAKTGAVVGKPAPPATGAAPAAPPATGAAPAAPPKTAPAPPAGKTGAPAPPAGGKSGF